jgi:hypothetical protein
MLLARVVDLLVEDQGIGPGEVDELENAGALLVGGLHEAVRHHPAVLDDQHLAGVQAAQVLGLQQVEGAGLGGQHVGVADPAQGQGTKPHGSRTAMSFWLTMKSRL